MTLGDDIRERTTPLLPAGESFRAAVPAVGGLGPSLPFLFRVVVVTDRRIHVFSAGWFRVGQPKRLLRTLAPGTVIETHPEFIYERLLLDGERLWVQPAYADLLREVVVASRATGAGEASG